MIPSLTAADVARLAPHANPKWAAALVATWPEICALAELTTPTRARHFLAQTAEESGGFRTFEENLSGYSAARLMEVWPGRFPTLASAQPYAHNAPALAEKVYGGRKDLGNTHPGDGWRFHGMGPIQVTGRAWAEKLATLTGLDLVNHPELMLEPADGWRCSAACWHLMGASVFADRGDLEGETRRINGALTNLAERRRYLAIANTLPLPMGAAPMRAVSPPATAAPLVPAGGALLPTKPVTAAIPSAPKPAPTGGLLRSGAQAAGGGLRAALAGLWATIHTALRRS